MLRKISGVLLCFSLFLSWGYAGIPELVENHELIEYAVMQLPPKGTLEQTEKGFVYLNVSDDYILQLYPFLLGNESALEIPPYFTKDGIGAHITVVPSSEFIEKGIYLLEEEIGRELRFTTTGIYSVKPDGWASVKHIWYLSVYCPELENFRQSKGLSPKVNDHDFHITIAIEHAKHILNN